MAATSAARKPSRSALTANGRAGPRVRTRSSSITAVTETGLRARTRGARIPSRAEIGTHAGVADTSLSLALDPKLVRMDVLRAGKDLDAAHGVYGDPRRSSAELGQLGVDAIVSHTVAAIRQAVSRR